jgi:hypothetical protein
MWVPEAIDNRGVCSNTAPSSGLNWVQVPAWELSVKSAKTQHGLKA